MFDGHVIVESDLTNGSDVSVRVGVAREGPI
jgi:hypothetical protein